MSNTQKFYRNKKELEIESEYVDAGSLWKLEHDNVLVLVDDDRFVSHKLTADFE